jgi:hypothetical protein
MGSLYFLLEDLGLSDAQRDIIWALTDADGDENDSPLPNLRNHWATRLDGNAKIYEGVFSDLTIGTMTSRLAQAGLNDLRTVPVPASIYGVQYDFEARIDKIWTLVLRWITFSAIGATWEDSHTAALLYLSDYKDLWGGVTLP